WLRACKAPVWKVNAVAYKTPGCTPVGAWWAAPVGGMIYPCSTATANANTTTAMVVWITSTKVRRSTRSATTPASGPMTRNGKDSMPAAILTQKCECEIADTSQGMVDG